MVSLIMLDNVLIIDLSLFKGRQGYNLLLITILNQVFIVQLKLPCLFTSFFQRTLISGRNSFDLKEMRLFKLGSLLGTYFYKLVHSFDDLFSFRLYLDILLDLLL